MSAVALVFLSPSSHLVCSGQPRGNLRILSEAIVHTCSAASSRPDKVLRTLIRA